MSPRSASNPIVYPRLIVGLGNPEPKYDRTRHNIGFAAIDALAQDWKVHLAETKRFKGEIAEVRTGGEKIYLLKPLTYMNRSGESIQSVLSWYKLDPESVMVIYDDMDLPLGRIRIRMSGSAGGHNGVKSTIDQLGTQKFPRLRIGIGRPRVQAAGTVSHVLGKFSPEEAPIVTDVLKLTFDAVDCSLKRGVEMAMNRYNSRNVAPTPPADPEAPVDPPGSPQPKPKPSVAATPKSDSATS
jgi:PTH1 family peptidyl-tRNA hydrolase